MSPAMRGAAAALCLASSACPAVELAGGAPAQVAIVPYFTVERGFSTLLEIRNESFTDIKAVKVVFHEARNGRVTLSFNGYLPPLSQHAFAVVGDSGVASVFKSDSNCTVPSFTAEPVTLRSFDFQGDRADGGPVEPSRVNEGYIVAYEMGKVNADHPLGQAISYGEAGIPRNCAAIVQAHSPPNGIWVNNINEGLSRPITGSLGVKAQLVNVFEGTLGSIPVTTLRDFSGTLLHRLAGEPLFLDAVNPGDSKVLLPGGTILQSRWDNPIDAVSAVLMVERARVNFSVDPALGAQSDYFIAMPTKPFYTDPAIVGSTARAPFTRVFGQGDECEVGNTQRISRQGQMESAGGGELCNVSNVYNANATTNQFETAVGSRISRQLTGSIQSGSILTLYDRDPDGFKRKGVNVLTSIEGHTFTGIPALSFSISNFINGNLGGLLSVYGESDAMVSESLVRVNGKEISY